MRTGWRKLVVNLIGTWCATGVTNALAISAEVGNASGVTSPGMSFVAERRRISIGIEFGNQRDGLFRFSAQGASQKVGRDPRVDLSFQLSNCESTS